MILYKTPPAKRKKFGTREKDGKRFFRQRIELPSVDVELPVVLGKFGGIIRAAGHTKTVRRFKEVIHEKTPGR